MFLGEIEGVNLPQSLGTWGELSLMQSVKWKDIVSRGGTVPAYSRMCVRPASWRAGGGGR
jgi:hypothetical protein